MTILPHRRRRPWWVRSMGMEWTATTGLCTGHASRPAPKRRETSCPPRSILRNAGHRQQRLSHAMRPWASSASTIPQPQAPVLPAAPAAAERRRRRLSGSDLGMLVPIRVLYWDQGWQSARMKRGIRQQLVRSVTLTLALIRPPRQAGPATVRPRLPDALAGPRQEGMIDNGGYASEIS